MTSRAIRSRGKGPPVISNRPSPATTARSPQAVVKFLNSCGLRAVPGNFRKAGDWFAGDVVDRKTGEPRGRRWVRPREDGHGFEIRREPPP